MYCLACGTVFLLSMDIKAVYNKEFLTEKN